MRWVLLGRALAGWLIIVPLSLAPSAGPAAATEGALRQSPVLGPSDVRISSGVNWEETPAVAWNGAEYLVVWADSLPLPPDDGGQYDIRGRRVSVAGVPLAPDFRISSPTGSDEVYPAVAWNATRAEYLVVWIDFRGVEGDIWGRRVRADGTTVGADFLISVSAPGNQGFPDVVWNATRNQYLVVWSDGRAGDQAPMSDIYGQRVGALGRVVGDEIHISGAGATGHDGGAAVAWNAVVNQYLVVWEDHRSGSDGNAYGRRISARGAPIGEDFRISSPAASAARPDVAWSGTVNRYLVVWEDYRDPSGLADLYGRRVRANGTVVGDADIELSGPAATSDEVDPAVAWSETAGQFLLVWQDRRDKERQWDIFGRKVRATGLPAGADFRICGPGAIRGDRYPALAWNGTGEFLVVWDDSRPTAQSVAIYGRRVSG